MGDEEHVDIAATNTSDMNSTACPIAAGSSTRTTICVGQTGTNLISVSRCNCLHQRTLIVVVSP